jgi:hypothetical protein
LADSDEEVPKLTAIEHEMARPGRRRFGNRSNTLTAGEERGRRLSKPNSKAKRYDGRGGRLRSGVTPSRKSVNHKLEHKPGTVSLPRVQEALENFYKEVELPELKQALAVTNDPRYNMLLAAINNPRFHGFSFPELCRRCKMTIQDVVAVWRNHMKVKGLVKMMNHMPNVMEDVAVDSKSRIVTCDTCQGVGKLVSETRNQVKQPICHACHGDGTIRISGDPKARELAFETIGLTGSGGGVHQQVNVNLGNQGIPTMEDQITDIDKVFEAEYTTITEEEKDVRNTEVKEEGEEAGETGGDNGGAVDKCGNADRSIEDSFDPPTDPTNYTS